jgi:hypothetical protein
VKDQLVSRGRFRAGLMAAVMASGVVAASTALDAAHATSSRSPSPARTKTTTARHASKQVVHPGDGNEAFGEWEDADESYLHDLAQSYSHFVVQFRSSAGEIYTLTGGHKPDGERIITVADGDADKPREGNTMILPDFQDWLARERTKPAGEHATVSIRELHTPTVPPATTTRTLTGRAKEIYDYLNNPNSPRNGSRTAAKLNNFATGYSPSAAKVFKYVVENPGATAPQMREGLGLSRFTVRDALENLTAKKLVTRTETPSKGFQYSVPEALPALEFPSS